MVPQFDIPSFVNLWTPPNYRLPKFLAAVNSFLSGISWKNGIFQAYMNGDPQLPYNSGTTYSTGQAVQYNFATYESIANSNTGNQPDISPTVWTLRCKSFIGARERATYNGRYLKLTYQLNRYFQQQITAAGLTGFRQPPYPAPYDFGLGGGVWSDIYITNAPITMIPFVAGPTSGTSSMVSTGTTISYVILGPPVYSSSSSYGFVVNIPNAVWTALGATSAIRNSIVNAFVAQYAASGTRWTINPY